VKPNDFDSVTAVIQSYFDGLYQGDVTTLRSIFHHDVCLKAPGIRRTLAQWLADVANRPIPAQQGQAFGFKLFSVDVVQDQAMVKIQCPLFEFNYVDFIGLLKEDDQWLIVSKMYTDIKLN
jgi:hypothetical protein